MLAISQCAPLNLCLDGATGHFLPVLLTIFFFELRRLYAVLMSAKFKPKKKEAEAIVDDWEAAEEDEEMEEEIEEQAMQANKATLSSFSPAAKPRQAAWEEEEDTRAESAPPAKVDGRTIWQEA